MKRILTYLTIVVLGVTNAQVLIDDTTTPNEAPDASAVLELRSADKGLLVPRLTTEPTGTPVEGLVYYDVTRKCFKGYNGTSWEIIGAGCLNAIPVVSIDQADSSIAEGDSGTQVQTVTITLDRNATEDIVVTLAYTGTANASDYSAPTSVTIANGSDSATFDITVNGDTNIEADETVIVSVDSVTSGSAVIGNESDYQLTIITDDLAATCDDSLVEFGFHGNSGDEETETADAIIANVSNAVISRGDGLEPASNGDSFRAKEGNASTLSEAIQQNEFFEITFDIANGFIADITAFDFNWDRSGTGATEVELRSNLDNYTSTLGSFTGLDDSQDNVINITSMNNVSGTVTFRLYAWGASGTGGTFGFEGPDRDVTIIGCLSAGTANPEVQFSEATATISEDSSTAYTITLNVANPGTDDINVAVSTSLNGGASNTDFNTTLPATFTIPAGDSSATYTFTPVNDTDVDAGESVLFTITSVSGNGTPQIGSTSTLEVSIIDDDAPLAQGVIISEIADPNNNANARFIELYNIGNTAVDISGYTLKRWTNGNSDPSAGNNIIIPANTSLAAGDAYVIVANESAFNTAFGNGILDQVGGNGGPAESNGDDNIGLFDSSDVLIDFFGVVGEDGSGTCHEFENGRALRVSGITSGATTWDESEWIVWADSTVSGCTSHTNNPQDAPNDFTPGTHSN